MSGPISNTSRHSPTPMRYNRIISYGRGTLPQLIEVAKNIKKKDSDLSQHMRDWYVKTRGCTKTEMALVLTDPEFMLTTSLKDKILSQNSIRLMQSDNFKKKSLYDKLKIVLEKVCSDTHRGSILGWPVENFAWVDNI